jgi:hypothetical protein
VFVRVSDAAVVFFFEFVLNGVGSGIAALPESFDEAVALFVIRELLEGGAFLIGDDVSDVFVQPLLVAAADFEAAGSDLSDFGSCLVSLPFWATENEPRPSTKANTTEDERRR